MMRFLTIFFAPGLKDAVDNPPRMIISPSGALFPGAITVKRKAEMESPDSAAKFLTGGSQTQNT